MELNFNTEITIQSIKSVNTHLHCSSSLNITDLPFHLGHSLL